MAMLVLQDGSLRRFPLYKGITRIGRDPTADVVLAEADLDHAHVLQDSGQFVVAPSGDAPILVNGKRTRRAILRDGDVVQVGEKTMMFSAADVPAQAETKTVLNAYRQLVQFSRHLTGSLSDNVDDLLTKLMDSMVELSHADKGFLILFEDGQPQVRVARNVAKGDVPAPGEELSDSILARVLADRRPLIITDALNDTEFSASVSVINLRLCSVICVPLTDGGELFGVVYLGSNTPSRLFDEATLDLVTVFSSQAALILRVALLVRGMRRDNLALRSALDGQRFGDTIGRCSQLRDVFGLVTKVAPTDASVLITGETGTGKELIANELHRRSPRAERPFVVVNCGAIPENLLESELFGHVKGAFTGAVATREGRFQAASGGTLFLDEIGELPLLLQVKLLRALQERQVTKVGETRSQAVDIRVIAATNRDLEVETKTGRFRSDLFYRLNVIGLHLPALRDRGDDIVLLAEHFRASYAQRYQSSAQAFSPQCMAAMRRHPWPGNIRELENCVKKAVIMTDRVYLAPSDLGLSDTAPEPVVPLVQAKEDFQRRYIAQVLERNNGNRTKTAQDLGVDPRTIFRHLERLDELGSD